MPPILQYGFRPFFFLAAVYAGIAVPLWLWLYTHGGVLAGPFDGLHWHAHEMVFGYLGAVLAGFILTAIPNWTGRLPLSGRPLAALVALWLAGRVAAAFIREPWVAMAVDLAFPLVLAFAVWREVVAGRNWKNAPIAAMITLFGAASALDYLGAMEILPEGLGIRLALGVGAVLIALVGGRIVPSFTRNWLVKQGATQLPASFGKPDAAAMATTILGALAWVVVPDWPGTGVLLVAAGVFLAIRMVRWRGYATTAEPIVLILHLGYAWLAAALALLGLAVMLPAISEGAALHALTAGAVGTMTLAVMTRASLGHTGRPIVADGSTVGVYALVTLGALLRVGAPLAGDAYLWVLSLGGFLWSAAFLLFAVRYAPVLWGRRVGA